MKIKAGFLLVAIIPLLSSCASQRVVLAPVGPNPASVRTTGSKGELQVFSDVIEENDDQNQAAPEPSWYQHSDYSIYNVEGKLVKRVDNTTGHYAQAPRRVALPAGRYVVKARGNDYLSVEVPVVIEPGLTTRVHLDDRWSRPKSMPKNEFVFEPSGQPVGWSAERSGQQTEPK